MVGKAKSLTKKKNEESIEKENLLIVALDLYVAELQANGKKGARTICNEVTEDHSKKTGHHVKISYTTLLNRNDGKQSMRSFNREKAWLSVEEEDVVVRWCEECAQCAIPLYLSTLREYCTHIAKARHGDGFTKLGVNWEGRFFERHSDRLKAYFSTGLDSARARAVNPATNAAWWKLLGDTLRENNIEPDCIYAADETGFTPGRGVKSCKVIGPVGKKNQKLKQSGVRGNITVLPVICADVPSLPPLVILAGSAFSLSWLQDNPLKASLGYSKKGYIDGELGFEFIKHFDDLTKRKANGRPRLFVVDGHSSRLNLNFLLYCVEHNILVLCYPSHSTHIYQGLDVIIFSVLNRLFSLARDAFESSTGIAIGKSNFLGVYAQPHIEAFTKANILSAFATTGIHPFNPAVVSSDDMAPSIETSISPNGFPLEQTSPTKAMTGLIFKRMEARSKSVANSPPVTPSTTSDGFAPEAPLPEPVIDPSLVDSADNTINELQNTRVAYLVAEAPIESSSEVPYELPYFGKPAHAFHYLLEVEATTELEGHLLEALREMIKRESIQYGALLGLQTGVILQNIYCQRVRTQLATKEKKNTTKDKPREKLVGDGLPRLLTDPGFIQLAREQSQRQEDQLAAKMSREVARVEYAERLKEWEGTESERKEVNNERTKEWKKEVTEWEEERDQMKLQKKKPRWTKPLRGPLLKPNPRPVRPIETPDVELAEENHAGGPADGDFETINIGDDAISSGDEGDEA